MSRLLYQAPILRLAGSQRKIDVAPGFKDYHLVHSSNLFRQDS